MPASVLGTLSRNLCSNTVNMVMCVWLDMMIFFRGSRSGSIFIKAARADGLTSWSDTRGRWVKAPFCPEGLRNRRKPEKPCARNPRIIRPEGWRLSGDSEEFLARGGVREDLARIIFGVVRSGKYHSLLCPDLMVPGIGAADHRREEQDPVDEKERK